MGTTQSHCPMRHQKREGGHGDNHPHLHPPAKTKPRGKPSPPSQPVVSNVTHNCVTLTWQPPRRHSGGTVYAYTVEMSTPADPKAWRVLSTSCQGNSFQAKNLQPEARYLFRVRAENIHGVSKASLPSEVAETRMFGVDQQGFVPAPEDRARPLTSPRHQPTISLHLEGTVTALLNHTDIQVKTNGREVKGSGDREGDGSSPKSDRSHRSLETLTHRDEVDGQGRRWRSGSLQRDCAARSSLQSDRPHCSSLQRDANTRTSLQPDRWKNGSSLQREAHQRSSLQPSRKCSLPILLPGTRTDSLNKLRDSQSFPVTNRAGRLNDAPETGRRRGLSGKERSVSDVDSGVSCSREVDVVDEGKPPKRDSGLEEDAENPWERDDSASELSDGVGSGHEDRKGEPFSPSPPDTPGWLGVSLGTEAGQADFRMLRRVLHSDDVMVKPAHSLPDIGGRKTSPHNTLSTIVDLEEEDDSVRITTL